MKNDERPSEEALDAAFNAYFKTHDPRSTAGMASALAAAYSIDFTDDHQQPLEARVKELEDERDSLAAAMPSEGSDAALAYAVEKSRADRLQAEVERLKVDARHDKQLIENLDEAHESLNRTCNGLRQQLADQRVEVEREKEESLKFAVSTGKTIGDLEQQLADQQAAMDGLVAALTNTLPYLIAPTTDSARRKVLVQANAALAAVEKVKI